MQRLRLAARAALTILLVAAPLASCSTVRKWIPGGSDGEEPDRAAVVDEAGTGEIDATPEVDVDSLPAYISKIKYHHLQSTSGLASADPMVNFEPQYLLHGAVSQADRTARFGNYYTIHWRAKDRSAPFTLRMEYRQKLTGAEIHTLEQVMNEVDRSNVARIEITGDSYTMNGPVTSWRISLVRDGTVVHSRQSFLWE